jgi:hypothetical protein
MDIHHAMIVHNQPDRLLEALTRQQDLGQRLNFNLTSAENGKIFTSVKVPYRLILDLV